MCKFSGFQCLHRAVYAHHCSWEDIVIALKRKSVSCTHWWSSAPSWRPWKSLIHTLSLWSYLLWTSYVSRASGDRLLSMNMTCSWFLHAEACISTSFLTAEKCILCMCSFLLSLYLIDVYLVVLQTLVIRNKAAMTIHNKLLCKHRFSIWGSIYQIVALQSHMVTLCYQMFWETGQLLNCISLLADEVEHLFTCSPTIHISSMEKYLFSLHFYL